MVIQARQPTQTEKVWRADNDNNDNDQSFVCNSSQSGLLSTERNNDSQNGVRARREAGSGSGRREVKKGRFQGSRFDNATPGHA